MKLRPLLALAALVSTPLLAHADTYDLFTLTGEGNTFTFTLPSSPMPSGTNGNCPTGVVGEFCLDNVTVNIVSGTETGTMEFFDTTQGGGLVFETLALFGDQLYSGTESSPNFVPNIYPLESGATPFPDYTLTIAAVTTTATTPEPSSWLLLSTGLLGGLETLRRRRA